MCTIFLLLVCLVCVGFGRRVQISVKQQNTCSRDKHCDSTKECDSMLRKFSAIDVHRPYSSDQIGRSNAAHMLVVLLICNPATGWQPTARCHSLITKNDPSSNVAPRMKFLSYPLLGGRKGTHSSRSISKSVCAPLACTGQQFWNFSNHKVQRVHMQVPVSINKWTPETVEQAIVFGFAFASGFSHVACFLQYKCFAGMMTGHTVNIGKTMTQLRWADLLFSMAMLSQFLSGCSIHRLCVLHLNQRPTSVAASIALFLFMLHDTMRLVIPASRWPALSLALGFGILAAISASTFGVITNLMTGHLLKLGTILADVLTSKQNQSQQAEAFKSIRALLAFLAGVASATIAIGDRLQAMPLFSMLGIFYLLLCLQYDRVQPKKLSGAS